MEDKNRKLYAFRKDNRTFFLAISIQNKMENYFK